MPYPETPYGILITTLAANLADHCASVGESVDWAVYSNNTNGAEGQHGSIIFNIPRTTSYDNDEVEIVVRTLIWRSTTPDLLKSAGDAFAFIDEHLRKLAQTGIRVTVGGTPYDLFKGWRVSAAYWPDDHINIDSGRSVVLEWILTWHTEGLLRNGWGEL